MSGSCVQGDALLMFGVRGQSEPTLCLQPTINLVQSCLKSECASFVCFHYFFCNLHVSSVSYITSTFETFLFLQCVARPASPECGWKKKKKKKR